MWPTSVAKWEDVISMLSIGHLHDCIATTLYCYIYNALIIFRGYDALVAFATPFLRQLLTYSLDVIVKFLNCNPCPKYWIPHCMRPKIN